MMKTICSRSQRQVAHRRDRRLEAGSPCCHANVPPFHSDTLSERHSKWWTYLPSKLRPHNCNTFLQAQTMRRSLYQKSQDGLRQLQPCTSYLCSLSLFPHWLKQLKRIYLSFLSQRESQGGSQCIDSFENGGTELPVLTHTFSWQRTWVRWESNTQNEWGQKGLGE